MHYLFRSTGDQYPMIKLVTRLAKSFWANGRRLTVPVPLLEFEFGSQRADSWVDFFKATSIPLFSERMRAALASCGVDNIDYYPARIRDTQTGEVRNYHAANIIGRVECVDRENSQFKPFGDSPISISSFDRLVLDEEKIRGLKMFRSAEYGLLLLVDEPIKGHLEAQGLTGLMFIKPDAWDGFMT